MRHSLRSSAVAVAFAAVLAACGATGSVRTSATTAASTAAPTTAAPTTTAPTTAAPTTAATTAAPTTPTTEDLSAACDPTALAAAAFAKEGISPNDPGYQVEGVDPAGVVGSPTCSGGWAFAVISRPTVGTTDGGTLFHVVGGRWTEVSVLGSAVDYCSLRRLGAPAAAAAAIETALDNPSSGAC